MKTLLKDFATSVVAVVETETPALVVVDAQEMTRLDKTRTFVQLYTLLNIAQ